MTEEIPWIQDRILIVLGVSLAVLLVVTFIDQQLGFLPEHPRRVAMRVTVVAAPRLIGISSWVGVYTGLRSGMLRGSRGRNKRQSLTIRRAPQRFQFWA